MRSLDPGSTQRWTTVIDGHRLRQLRRQHGLSQEQLAWHAGMSLTTIARLASTTPHAEAALSPGSPPPSANRPAR